MKSTINRKTQIFLLGIMIGLGVSCVADRNFDALETDCTDGISANIGYAGVMALYEDQTLQIQEDWIIEGYVVSSDEAGNFFSELYIQDHPTVPTAGFQLEMDLRDSHLFYPGHGKVFVKLQGLYLGKSGERFKLGGTFIAFGNLSVGRLPANAVDAHIFWSCDQSGLVSPVVTDLEAIADKPLNTLVQIMDLEVSEADLGLPFAVEREETTRILTDCGDRSLILLNSGFADFQNEPLPQGNGSITGVLTKDKETFQLIIRDLDDMDFTGDRCEDVIDEFTSKAIIISELADPDNNSGARFVELYNTASLPLSLKGWTLRRYTNDNTAVSSTIDLSGLVIGVESTLLISPNAGEFESVYGFSPDLAVGTNSPADSNGDDNLELIDPFGTVIDVFGVPGEDGTGTSHEFEDGRAVRNLGIIQGNPLFTFSEWTIYNDTGASGTLQLPQNAPDDFNPGIRE
ncbi:MAG: DUF5689 domain-containing protein [Bacteroidota bacterium]